MKRVFMMDAFNVRDIRVVKGKFSYKLCLSVIEVVTLSFFANSNLLVYLLLTSSTTMFGK